MTLLLGMLGNGRVNHAVHDEARLVNGIRKCILESRATLHRETWTPPKRRINIRGSTNTISAASCVPSATITPDEARLLAWPARPGDKPAFYRVLKLALLEWSNGAFDGGIAESWTELRARVAEATDVARSTR